MSPAAKPKILTTAEFHAAVHALAPAVAVFDCDGTLWSGDAGVGFMRWTIDNGLLSRDTIDWLDDRYRAYLRGEVSELAICGEMVQIYQGLRESEMRSAAAEFFATQIEPNLFAEMQTLVRELQARGSEIWAVSSTCNWVVEEGMRRFEIPSERILATRVAVVEGFVTPTLHRRSHRRGQGRIPGPRRHHAARRRLRQLHPRRRHAGHRPPRLPHRPQPRPARALRPGALARLLPRLRRAA